MDNSPDKEYGAAANTTTSAVPPEYAAEDPPGNSEHIVPEPFREIDAHIERKILWKIDIT